MARINTTNWFLLVAVLGAGAYFWADRKHTTTKERSEREHSAVQLFRPDALGEIQFERDGQKFRLFRALDADAGSDARAWKIEQDGRTEPADAFAVDRALSSLDHASFEREIRPEEINRPQFGLAPARLKLRFTQNSLSTYLEIGGPAATPDNALYLDDNGKVKVARRTAFDFVDVAADGFRSRSLVPYLSTDLRQISLRQGEQTATLEKLIGLSWKLADGPLAGTRVDRFVLERMLTTFPDLKADHFLPEPDARKAQEGAPQVTVVMTPSDGQKPVGEFTVGGPCPGHPDEVVVTRPRPRPLFACSAKGTLDALQRTPEQLADTRLLSLREDELDEILITQGDRRVELARKGNNWKQRAPVEADVAADQARALVKALGTARGELLARAAPADFAPSSRVTVHGPHENEEARPAEVLDVSKPSADGSVVVQRQQDGAFLRVERDSARVLFPQTTALRSTQVLDRSIDRAKQIRVYEQGTLRQEVSRQPDGSWTLVTPKGYPIDIGLVSDLAERLLHLSAEQWVADRDDGSFGLQKPRWRAEVQLDEGADAGGIVTRTLKLGEAGPAGVHAQLDGVEGVFLLPRSIEQVLGAWPLDLTVFTPALGEGDTLTLQGAEQKLSVRLVRGQLRPVEGSPDLTPSRLEALRTALDDLRAQSVVHLGAAHKEEGFEKPALRLQVKRAAGSASRDRTMTFGASDVLRNASVFYGRAEGVEATYAVPAARVRAVLDAL